MKTQKRNYKNKCKNKYNSRRKKQKGGDVKAILRKNNKNKDIKEYEITKQGIQWQPGAKTRMKQLFKIKGSQGKILFDNITDITKEGNEYIIISTDEKIYIFDNAQPCEYKGVKCSKARKMQRFYDTLMKKYQEYQDRRRSRTKPQYAIPAYLPERDPKAETAFDDALEEEYAALLRGSDKREPKYTDEELALLEELDKLSGGRKRKKTKRKRRSLSKRKSKRFRK
tara:strand:+ start:609 stop:1286 length:678 start_codon:yes stop_codon:yes gene_type:complete